MLSLRPNTQKLVSRNEGKIKSYESCFDIRAWSHDILKRDQYLKEWIKCDMPYSFVSIGTVISILRKMSSGRNRGRSASRCHRDCKSKLVLDNICTSCHAMKHCLRCEEKFERYFIEEELETSHWPCEKCLEALKSIKMFWKIIIDKVFNISVSKNSESENDSCSSSKSVRDLANKWQKDLVQQACLVKAINQKNSYCSTKIESCKKQCCINKMHCEGDRGSSSVHVLSNKTSKVTIQSSVCKCKSMKCDPSKCESSRRMKQGRYTSVRVKTCDVGCNTLIRSDNDELRSYRNKLENHKKSLDEQYVEVNKLKEENCALKMELENMRKCRKRERPSCREMLNGNAIVPKCFDVYTEENTSFSGSVKPTESEMVITLKNCANSNYKHVSLLQVLHKTNETLPIEASLEGPRLRKEDPVALLSKVQNTLGAIFRREMCISAAREKSEHADIEATFNSLTSCSSTSFSSRQCNSSGFLK